MTLSIGILILALLTSSCSRQGSAPKVVEASTPGKNAGPIAVRTASAETRLVERAIDVTGALMADESVQVSPEIAGRVASIHFDFGQNVRKGEIVAEIDQREFQIQLDRSKATLAQALARVGLRPGEEDSIPSETPAVRQARAQYEDAKSKFDSARKLVDSGDISREKYVELEKSLQARKAAVDVAIDDMRVQVANIETLKADKRLAEKRLSDTILRAPFDGQVSQRAVSPGQYIKENTTILTLVKSWPLRLRLDVPENATAAIHLGDTLRFSTEAIPGREFSAVVRELNPALESRSRSLTAEARINEADKRLRPGMFVQVRLTISKSAPIVVVPREALYTVAGLSKVFAIRSGKAVELRISPGQSLDKFIEVPGDFLKPGEPVAVENIGQLFDGADVSPKI